MNERWIDVDQRDSLTTKFLQARAYSLLQETRNPLWTFRMGGGIVGMGMLIRKPFEMRVHNLVVTIAQVVDGGDFMICPCGVMDDMHPVSPFPAQARRRVVRRFQ